MNIFIPSLLNHSNNKNYNDALLEWNYIHTDYLDDGEFDKCICGHPIQEVCIIKNKINGVELHLGNCCINKITNLMNDKKIYNQLINYKVGKELILFIEQKKILDDFQLRFLTNVRNKRNISPRQFAFRKNLFDIIRSKTDLMVNEK